MQFSLPKHAGSCSVLLDIVFLLQQTRSRADLTRSELSTGSELSRVPGSSPAGLRFGVGRLAFAAILSAGLGLAASLVETRYTVFQITPARAIWPLLVAGLSVALAASLRQTWSLPALRPCSRDRGFIYGLATAGMAGRRRMAKFRGRVRLHPGGRSNRAASR